MQKLWHIAMVTAKNYELKTKNMRWQCSQDRWCSELCSKLLLQVGYSMVWNTFFKLERRTMQLLQLVPRNRKYVWAVFDHPSYLGAEWINYKFIVASHQSASTASVTVLHSDQRTLDLFEAKTPNWKSSSAKRTRRKTELGLRLTLTILISGGKFGAQFIPATMHSLAY